MVVRYEDLRRDSEQVIGQLLKFLGVTPDSRIIRKAIKNNSLQQMRAKEDDAIKAGEQSALLGCHQSPGGEEGRFIRKGSVGGWRSELTDDNVRLIGQYAGDVLATLEYESGLVEEQRSVSTSALSI
jgi:hypothetical protein